MTLTVGIDIGGTSVRAMAFDSIGDPVAKSQVPTVLGDEGVISSVMRAWAGLAVDEPIVGAGVGVPGQVDPRSGSVRLAVNLGIGDSPFPLGSALSDHLGLPVAVENDVKVAALGMHESLSRRGHAPSSLALLNVGTGISAGIVIDGDIFRGNQGMAGEIGHVVVDENGPECVCGQKGCLEVMAAGPALATLSPDVALAQAGRFLAHALIWLAATFDVERLFIGGGVSQSGEPFLSAIRAHLTDLALSSSLARHRLSPDQLDLAPVDGSTGARGGAALARRMQRLSLTQ